MGKFLFLITFFLSSLYGEGSFGQARIPSVRAFPCVENIGFDFVCKADRFAINKWELLERYARTITVRVRVDGDWGSGVIIQKKDNLYTVLTNNHVVSFGRKYQIETFDHLVYDGVIYRAIAFRGKNKLEGTDLALVQFRSPKVIYPVATLGETLTLKTGEDVFAAGFLLENRGESDGFRFRAGLVGLKPDHPMLDGYQFAYTSDVEGGMSGGPVLNSLGQVVAVNGLRSQPLVDDAYVFQNGAKPCAPMVNLMRNFAFGIPMETFMALAAKPLKLDYSLPQQDFESSPIAATLPNVMGFSLDSPMWQTLLMQEKIARAKQCLW